MNREEHLDWAKTRALEYVNRGDTHAAIASMISDLGKHEELASHPGLKLGRMLLVAGMLGTIKEATDWITGFN